MGASPRGPPGRRVLGHRASSRTAAPCLISAGACGGEPCPACTSHPAPRIPCSFVASGSKGRVGVLKPASQGRSVSFPIKDRRVTRGRLGMR